MSSLRVILGERSHRHSDGFAAAKSSKPPLDLELGFTWHMTPSPHWERTVFSSAVKRERDGGAGDGLERGRGSARHSASRRFDPNARVVRVTGCTERKNSKTTQAARGVAGVEKNEKMK